MLKENEWMNHKKMATINYRENIIVGSIFMIFTICSSSLNCWTEISRRFTEGNNFMRTRTWTMRWLMCCIFMRVWFSFSSAGFPSCKILFMFLAYFVNLPGKSNIVVVFLLLRSLKVTTIIVSGNFMLKPMWECGRSGIELIENVLD